MPAGETQTITSVSYSFANDKFDADGEVVAIESFEKLELRGFAEYGLTNWATLTIQPEWRWKASGDDAVNGLGRVDLGVRSRLWRNDASVFSAQGTVRIPGTGDPLEPLDGGDTEWEIEGRLLFGHGFSLWSRHAFANIEAGYRHRLGDPPDELQFDLTAGIDLRDDVLWLVQSFNSVSISSPKGAFQDTREHKLSLSAVYRIDERWSLQTGALATAYGRNVLREQGGFIALWAKF